MDPQFPQSLSLNEHRRIQTLERLLYESTAVTKASAKAAYIDKYAKNGKMFKGKWRRWDTRTGTWYDAKVAQKFINLETFGTETPRADLKYLKAKNIQMQREKGVYYNDPIREKLSKKLVIDDNNQSSSVYAKEQRERKKADRQKLYKLRQGTSFHRLDIAVRKGTIESEANEWGPGGQPPASQQLSKTQPVEVPLSTKDVPSTLSTGSDTLNPSKSIDLDEGTAAKNAKQNNAPASLARQRNLTALQNNPNQVGNLRINPGGIVGRWDDVRTSDGRSTALSIAQQDFMGIKKGDQLSVLTRAQRRKYDRDVLKIGG